MNQNLCYNCFSAKQTIGGPCPGCGYDNAPNTVQYPTALREGGVLNGQYIVGRVLGQGGFGITYLAYDHQLKVKVAIKEYLPDGMATRMPGVTLVSVYSGEKGEHFNYGAERFLDEARTLAKFIGNKNIVAVKSYFKENNTAYFVMDYVEGISFKNYIKNKGGRVDCRDALRVLLPVMDALAAVHREGFIHRDVTPDNIYITQNDEIKLLDFGSAKYSLGDKSKSLDVILKAGYAPKEQYLHRSRQGPFTDVYSLAACFYASITGFLPPDSLERMEQDTLVSPSARNVNIAQSLEYAILKGLSVKAENRFQSMEEFRAAIGNVSVSQPAGAAKDPAPPVIQPQPAPQPYSSAPQPAAPASQPRAPAPQPYTHAPQPVAPASQPRVPAPQPYTPAPQPVAPAPQPRVPAPQPYSPAPQPYAPAPQPYPPAPQPVATGPRPGVPMPRPGVPAPPSEKRPAQPMPRKALIIILVLSIALLAAALLAGINIFRAEDYKRQAQSAESLIGSGSQLSESAQAQIDMYKRQAEAAQSQIDTYKRQAEAAQSQIDTYRQQAEAAQSQIDTYRRQAEAAQNALYAVAPNGITVVVGSVYNGASDTSVISGDLISTEMRYLIFEYSVYFADDDERSFYLGRNMDIKIICPDGTVDRSTNSPDSCTSTRAIAESDVWGWGNSNVSNYDPGLYVIEFVCDGDIIGTFSLVIS